MIDRNRVLKSSIASTQWHGWKSEPIGADASSRRYFRLVDEGAEPVILVDAPPDKEDFQRFLDVAKLLSKAGLCVPKPNFEDHQDGVFIVTDLGLNTLSQALGGGSDCSDQTILDVLMILRSIEFSTDNKLNASTAQNMLEPLFENYGASGQSQICSTLESAFHAHVTDTLTLSLRDFHAENIIWREDEHGTNKVGLLDFQDAFLAPDGYDLASFTRDVRHAMPMNRQRKMEKDMAVRLNIDAKKFQLQVAILAIQRNLRILGVFAKLISQGKMRYAEFLPLTWQHIVNDLEHAGLSELKGAILENVPNPDLRGWTQT